MAILKTVIVLHYFLSMFFFSQDASGTEESNDAMGESSGDVQQPPDASEVLTLSLFNNTL